MVPRIIITNDINLCDPAAYLFLCPFKYGDLMEP